MSKRYGREFDNYNSSPAKRSKIEGTRGGIVHKERRQSVDGVAKITNDDLWGDDFDDDAIEELDFVASQACSQDVNVSTDSRMQENVSKVSKPVSNFQPVASTSRASSSNSLINQVFRRKEKSNALLPNKSVSLARNNGQVASQKLASSENVRELVEDECSMAFDDFRTNLLGQGNLNSTFVPRNDVVIVSDDARLRKLEKLEQDYKKLMDDFMIKEGETVFLRNQLQQNLLRAENEKAEKARLIEDQASRHRSEMSALHKEKDGLKTQNDFQALQLGTLMERCKLLETGAVKLTAPQRAVVSNDSPNRSRFGLANRSMSTPKAVKVAETSVQTSGFKKSCWNLKTVIQDHPLDIIPQSIFEASLPEKSVVDIQIVEKFGKKNLPILQEEDTFRIFENPDLVKPLVSVVDDRKLNVNYFSPEVAVIMKMTSAEINSKDCIPIVNKIVSTTRELLLNSTTVLQTIASAMKNDDIRDMNDLYFSDFYDTRIDYDKTVCDSNVWYEKERGIETRRSMGTLSFLAEESNYLAEYIAGKSQLFVDSDENYTNYNKQMLRYFTWHQKGHDFEFLEMILEFVTALGLVRRSHQFTGLICAIAKTLSSVQNKVGFCPAGLQYVSTIFKELVFARPLAHCFVPLTEMMKTFCKSTAFGQKICTSTPNTSQPSMWKGEWHFTPDACPLEIYMEQLERFPLDDLMTVDISHAFLSFVHFVFLSDSISWVTESSNSCSSCWMRVLTYTITLLSSCSKIDVRILEQRCFRLKQRFAKNDDNFWPRFRRKQLNVLRKGIRFLSYLAKRDPDFIIRVSNVEDSFHLFMQRITVFDSLVIHENEQEALALIKSTLTFDKPAPTERRSQQSQSIFRVRDAFKSKAVPSPASGKIFDVKKMNSSSQHTIKMYKDVLKG